ncbi:ankyrin repeat domain-containing protein [Brevibacillus choshinensis]|uniref:ankyrin repeat domain-containing protein n=1 Tax=Brevibacillus choshinensis TaxID=54911 RepID=UPI002E1AD807|nr:ankyrin repeat domain-containing protein [Brevibacillus choshinensis]MED4583417.1 ankyrin repeat domain-containing protein [Brevibacillus choshinensis]MED4752701.1 ankyrin repeat domain-containing protein [Brevibacillus choshinensis]MED4782687.1 ankyrin repeat domain-containing protein [Brevibacillus choshinensis]
MNAATTIKELFQASQAGDSRKVKDLLEKDASLANTENEEGLTPLGYAAHFGHVDVVRLLLEKGADVQAVSHSKIAYIPSNTALHAAIAGEGDVEVVGLLLASGANTNTFDSNGHTCLHTAAFHDKHIEIIRLLIAHGAQVNEPAKNEGRQTPLALALEKGNAHVVELLRQHGAV